MALVSRNEARNLVKDPEVTGWYSSGTSKSSSKILEQTFQYAKTLITAEFGEKGGVLAAVASMSDVQCQLQRAQEAYQSSRQSKPRQWLVSLSERITTYGHVLDVMVQHHPEYVSLAWGLFKFVFTAVVNHQEIITNLSKGLCLIADILPRADLALILYPTDLMQQSLAQLYSHVLQVLLQAMQWYKLSRRKHAFSSIFKPWALSFKEHFEATKQDAVRLDRLSDMATKAELRDTHVDLIEAKRKMELLQADNQLLIEVVKLGFNRVEGVVSSMHQELRLDLRGEKEMICNIQLEQILSMAWVRGLPEPSNTLHCYGSLRSELGLTIQSVSVSRNLSNMERCISQPGPLLMSPSSLDRDVVRSKGSDMLNYVEHSGAPSLRTVGDASCPTIASSIVRIFKILLMQALAKNPQMLGDGVNPLTPAHLREAVYEEDWLQILQRCIRDLPGVSIFIERYVFGYVDSILDDELGTRTSVLLASWMVKEEGI